MNIDDLIKYENENTTLDFKSSQYIKEQYEALLKDVMSMANADTTNDKFIIVGIKHRSSGEREYLGIERSEFMDSATYQQLILENIEPDIQLDYFPYEFEGKVLGIFRISNCLNRPYMMKKDYKSLKRGDCFIRKGSQQSRMVRRDFELIFDSKKTSIDYDQVIQIAFRGSNGMQEIELPAVEQLKLPSERAKEKILRVIEQKKNEPRTNNVLRSLGSLSSLSYPFGGEPYEDRSLEELEKNLAGVKETYRQDDYYEFFEEHSHKINITILNSGSSYLEDCSIEINVRRVQGLLIASRIYDKPDHSSKLFIKPSAPKMENIMYPMVDQTEEAWIIKQEIGDIRHHIPTDAFEIDLRVIPRKELINKIIEFECRLFGKNLSCPLKRTLKIKIKDTK